MSWASYDLGDYKGAAEGFSKAGCDSTEKGKFHFLSGFAWMKAGINVNARTLFASLIFRNPNDVEPVTGVSLGPLAYAYFARLAADSGDADALDEMRRNYGGSFDQARVVWIDEAMRPLGTASVDAASRDYRALSAEARLEDYALYQKVRALSIRGSFDEMRALPRASLDAVAGTYYENGEIRDLAKSLGMLLEGTEQVEATASGRGMSMNLWLLVFGAAAVVLAVSMRR